MFAQDETALASPDWIRDAAVYEVSLRSMSEDSRFFTFEDRLMKLKSWGADAVCLEPVFAVSDSKVPRALSDVRSVRDFVALSYEFGTKDAFKSMIQQAHYAGLKVLLTWVDTTSRDHPWMKSKPEWYVAGSSDPSAVAGSTVSSSPDLAVLDLSNAALQDELIKIMVSWVTDNDIDGFKIQTEGAPQIEFWVKARKALSAAKKNFVLISEDALPEGHLRAFDVSPSSASHALLKRVIAGEADPESLETFIRDEEKAFPAGSLRARYLETLHSERARTAFGPAQRAAAAFNATIPGIAWITAGEEAGESKTLPLNAKSPIDWKNADKDLVKFYKSLLRLRRDHPAMSRGQLFQVRARSAASPSVVEAQASASPSGAEKMLAYARTYRGDAVLVAINFSDREWKGRLEVPEIFKSDKGALKLKAALTEHDFSAGTLTLPPYGFQVFTAK